MHSNRYIIVFVLAICTGCALILSVLSTSLLPRQERARETYLYTQLLVAANIIPPETKVPESKVLEIYNARVEPKLTNQAGDLFTFEDLNIDMSTYLRDNQKIGYAKLQYKLVYIIKDDGSDNIYGYVIPINGYGLWDAIYGYLCLAPDADTVIGTTWYEQKETPGLGAEIATAKWQSQFPGKVVFREHPDGSTNFQATVLGIRVVKTTVEQTYGDSPAGNSAVDGIAGATKTSEGVTSAYQSSLAPYRNFLIRVHDQGGGA